MKVKVYDKCMDLTGWHAYLTVGSRMGDILGCKYALGQQQKKIYLARNDGMARLEVSFYFDKG